MNNSTLGWLRLGRTWALPSPQGFRQATRRRIMVRVALVSACLTAWAPMATAQQDTAPAGTIKTLKGQVSVTRNGQATPATAGMGVLAQDVIRTGADSSVGITLRDQTLLSAGPQSTIDLRQFQFDSTTQTGAIDAHVRRGTLAVVSGSIARHSPQSVRFSTPAMTLGVRGTEFIVDAGDRPE